MVISELCKLTDELEGLCIRGDWPDLLSYESAPFALVTTAQSS